MRTPRTLRLEDSTDVTPLKEGLTSLGCQGFHPVHMDNIGHVVVRHTTGVSVTLSGHRIEVHAKLQEGQAQARVARP